MASMSVPRWSVYVVIAALIASLSFSIGAVYTARGDNHDTVYWACLYAGSLSQVGTTEPANCGRGATISWNAQGVQGIPGVSGYTMHTVSVNSGATSTGVADAGVTCPDGRVPTGGGYQITGDDANSVVVRTSQAVAASADNNPFNYPIYSGSFTLFSDFGWEFRVHNTLAPNGGGFSATFYVYCVEMELPEPV